MLIMGMPGSYLGNICDFWLFTDRDAMCYKEGCQQNNADLSQAPSAGGPRGLYTSQGMIENGTPTKICMQSAMVTRAIQAYELLRVGWVLDSCRTACNCTVLQLASAVACIHSLLGQV